MQGPTNYVSYPVDFCLNYEPNKWIRISKGVSTFKQLQKVVELNEKHD